MNYLAFFVITSFAMQVVLPSNRDAFGIVFIQVAGAISAIALAIWVLA